MRIVPLFVLLLAVALAKQCGKGTAGCTTGNCCSYWGYCGAATAYCGTGTYQCACDCTAKGSCMTVQCQIRYASKTTQIRKTASASGVVVKTINRGDTVCFTDKTSTGWAKLNDGNYVFANDLMVANPNEPNPTPTPTPTPTCTKYEVNASSLNIRTGPGTTYGTAGTYSRGAIVCVVAFENNNAWAKLDTGKYVSAQYLVKTTVTTGDGRMCPTFWDGYAKNRYPTREEFALGTRALVGKNVVYTQNYINRWSGINKKICPPSVPPTADCSSYATWMYWTAFGRLADKVNNSKWSAGYTGTMITVGTKTSCLPGDSYQYSGHATIYVGSDQVVSYGTSEGKTDPVRLKAYTYRSDRLGCYRHDFPFGQPFST